jgi:hypothetical protein
LFSTRLYSTRPFSTRLQHQTVQHHCSAPDCTIYPKSSISRPVYFFTSPTAINQTNCAQVTSTSSKI